MLLGKMFRVSLFSSHTNNHSMSNGGGFIGTIACDAVGGQFAALAAGSGAFYTDINGPNNGCTPARSPLPVLEIHGGADKTVFYNGGQGEGGPEPPIPDW